MSDRTSALFAPSAVEPLILIVHGTALFS